MTERTPVYWTNVTNTWEALTEALRELLAQAEPPFPLTDGEKVNEK